MQRRVLLSILMVLAATVLALGVPLGIVSWRVVDDLAHRELSSRLESIAASISAQQEAQSDLDLRQLEVAIPAGGRLDIRIPGRIEQSAGAPPSDEVYSDQLVIAGGGLLRLSAPIEQLRSEQFTALLLVGLAILLSLVVGTGVALILTRRLANPLTDVARRAARLGLGDFRTFRRRYDIAELDRVADVLDASARDIAALIARERDLASNISHQLRTRLTGLRLRLEELADHPDPAVKEEVREALEQTDRLVTVVDGLLADARSQRAAGAGELVLIDELEELRADWEPQLRQASRELLVRCPPSVVVHATGSRLREALGVLVENALQHGAGTVRVTVRPADLGARMVVVEVTDEGAGVPEGLVGHIFERGVSIASSTGIGLSLARAFVEADGGRLELRRASPPVFAVFLAVGAPETGDIGGSVDDAEQERAEQERAEQVRPEHGEPAPRGVGLHRASDPLSSRP